MFQLVSLPGHRICSGSHLFFLNQVLFFINSLSNISKLYFKARCKITKHGHPAMIQPLHNKLEKKSILKKKNKFEHLRIVFCSLIHTSNKIALQFHKINVPVYIYRKKQTVHHPPSYHLNSLRGTRKKGKKNKHHKNPNRQYSAQRRSTTVDQNSETLRVEGKAGKHLHQSPKGPNQ